MVRDSDILKRCSEEVFQRPILLGKFSMRRACA